MKAAIFEIRRFGILAGGLLLAGIAVSTINWPDSANTSQQDKRQLALWGGLELERAVQALKDSILRGDSSYSDDFDRYMEEVERAVYQYRARGALDQQEQQALDRLEIEVPRYRAAIATVHQMRDRNAPITEIDNAVKGEDRPISAAFEQLDAQARGQGAVQRAKSDLSTRVFLSVTIAGAILALFLLPSGQISLFRARAKERSLRESTMSVVRWQEEKESRAHRRLHDGVCQSLAAVMYLLRGSDGAALAASGTSLRVRLDAILQESIRDTRAIAWDLCPPRSHDDSLLGSLEIVWTDARTRLPNIQLSTLSALREDDIPMELKRELVQIAPMAIEWARQESDACQLVWNLSRERNRIRLAIGVQTGAVREADRISEAGRRAAPRPADAIGARVVLSGGKTAGIQEMQGGRTLITYWAPY
jgi:hypothetical protein